MVEILNYDDYQRTNLGCFDYFFHRYVSKGVYIIRLLILPLAVIWFGISLWRASIIHSEAYTQQFFSSDQPVQRVLDLQQNELYNGQDTSINIKFYFGVQDHLANSGRNVSKWDTSYQGELAMQPILDLSPESA